MYQGAQSRECLSAAQADKLDKLLFQQLHCRTETSESHFPESLSQVSQKLDSMINVELFNSLLHTMSVFTEDHAIL